MFGGVYVWGAGILAAGLVALAGWIRPSPARQGWLRVLDLSLAAILAAIVLQLVPLPAGLVAVISPARVLYQQAMRLDGAGPGAMSLALDRSAGLHALTAALCTFAAFWVARAQFSRHGIRTVVTILAWTAIAFVLAAVAQSAADTTLVYGFWRPYGAGARPFGPFINRNHAGTWSLLTLLLCAGCYQWRRSSSSPPRGWRWRSRLAHAVNGRSLILVIAVSLLTAGIGLVASRSTLVGLVCAAGYLAWTAPRGFDGRRRLRGLTLACAAAAAFLAYSDFDTLASRLDQTRRLGLAGRVAIWKDTVGAIRDFPVTGVGAGNYANAMRVYQTTDRTYYWNEAHNHYLQVAAEGGALIAAPAALALCALAVAGVRMLRVRTDPVHWMRLGASAALVAVAVQAIWETGLTLPANGMLAAVAAAILVHEPRRAPADATPE